MGDGVWRWVWGWNSDLMGIAINELEELVGDIIGVVPSQQKIDSYW